MTTMGVQRLIPSDSNTNESACDWRASIDRLNGAYSDHTLKGYHADLAIFESWCLANGCEVVPATPEQVAAFLAWNAPRASVSTLKRRLAAIRKIHRLARAPCPVDDEEVAIALRRAMRGKVRRPKQARGLTAALRDQLLAACPDTLIGLRDRAMIAVGYDTLCRRSELANIAVDDLVRLPNGGGKILVRRAKNDPFGDGRWAFLSAKALAHLDRWLEASGVAEGYVFRRLINATVHRISIDSLTVNRRIKAAAERAGLEESVWRTLTGHSMRVGAAQDLMCAGRDILVIMTAGGWTSMNVVGRYVRDAQLNVWG
jgi:integrase/recombinase XerD